MRALLLLNVQGIGKAEPLGDTHRERAFLFHLFEDQEVVPVGKVLHAGDPVGVRVFERQFEAVAALFGRGRGYVDQTLRGLAQDAGGLAVRTVIDLSTFRRLSGPGDAGGCQSR